MTYVFVDTNILLHYRRVEEIDWCRLFEDDRVTVIFAPIVIRELDTHKFNHPSQKIRNRSREVLAALRSTFASSSVADVHENLAVRVLSQEPEIDFEEHGLRREINDDWLLGSMIAFQRTQRDGSVVLVTADFGLDLKARSAGFMVLPPPDEARLPDDLDASEKRIKQLERENASLRIRLPELSLTIGEKSVARFSLSNAFDDDVHIESELAKIREQYPRAIEPSAVTAAIRNQSLGELLKLGGKIDLQALTGPAEYNRYNSELESFYAGYEHYLQEIARYREQRRRRIEFTITLHNSGGIPADDIDIHMHFPDGFGLWTADKEPVEPAPPDPPRPLGHFEPMSDILNRMTFPSLTPPHISMLSNVSKPEITKTNSYDVTQHVRSLKHGYTRDLATYVLIFESADVVGSFQVNYAISAANLPTAAMGVLSFVIATEESGGKADDD